MIYCSIKVNEALTSVQELKSDVKGFMTTARDGLKNEKAWQREMGNNVSKKLQDFQTEIATSNQYVKRQRETQTKNFNDELVTFKNELKDRDMDFNDKLEAIDNEMKERNRELEAKIVINEQIRKELNKQMRKELNIMRANQDTLESENEVLRQTIIGMKSELTKLQETLTPPPTTASTTRTTTQPSTTTTMTTTTKTAFLHSCDEGWENFQGHCYLYVKGGKTFDEATVYCNERNAYLTEITTDLEVEFVIQLKGYYTVWLGAQYSASEGRFVYTHNKQSVPEKYWATGEPDNRREDENCAYLSYSGLYAYSCSKVMYFICEKP